MDNGRLTRSSLFGNPEPLLAAGKNLFRSEKEPEGTTIFFTNEEGRMTLAGYGLEGIPYSESSNLLLPYLRIAVLVLCLFFLLSSLPYALFWGVLKLAGKMKDVRLLNVRVYPLLAALALLVAFLGFNQLHGTQAGALNFWTLAIFLGTFFFPVFSLVGLVRVLVVPKSEIHRGVRIHSLLVSGACCVLTGFFWSWGLLALRTWAD